MSAGKGSSLERDLRSLLGPIQTEHQPVHEHDELCSEREQLDGAEADTMSVSETTAWCGAGQDVIHPVYPRDDGGRLKWPKILSHQPAAHEE